jgi:hypothetical protein
MRRSRDEYRSHLIDENEENARLTEWVEQMNVDMERLAYERNEARAQLAKVNESPYSPAFMAAIAGTCSTPASRVGKTQAEVFDEEKK